MAVIHPYQPKYVGRDPRTSVSAPNDYARTQKDAKYKASLLDAGLLFVPFVADVFGNLCDEASALVYRLAKSRAIREGEPPSKVARIAQIRISFTIASAVAKMLVPAERASEVSSKAPGGMAYGPSTQWFGPALPTTSAVAEEGGGEGEEGGAPPSS